MLIIETIAVMLHCNKYLSGVIHLQQINVTIIQRHLTNPFLECQASILVKT